MDYLVLTTLELIVVRFTAYLILLYCLAKAINGLNPLH